MFRDQYCGVITRTRRTPSSLVLMSLFTLAACSSGQTQPEAVGDTDVGKAESSDIFIENDAKAEPTFASANSIESIGSLSIENPEPFTVVASESNNVISETVNTSFTSSNTLNENVLDTNQASSFVPLNGEPEFIEVSIDDVTTTTARITWTLSEFATGQIEYGTTQDFGNFTAEETSYDFSTHIQTITGLSADTDYVFRLLASDPDGNEVFSDVYSFTTAETIAEAADNDTLTNAAVASSNPPSIGAAVGGVDSTPVGNWADASAVAGYDESQPMAGIFVGTPNGGVFGAANTANANHHSIRFRAPRTGTLTSVLFQNRVNAVSSVFSRAASQPKYQACLDFWASKGDPFVNVESVEQLRKANKCAYHIGNYYSAGNGGSVIFEIRPDANGIPNMDVAPLGKTDTPFVAIDNQPNVFINHPLDSAANVVAGAYYHIVLRNLTPVVGKTSNLTVEEAFNMPDNTGALSINGVQFPKGANVEAQQGPFFGGHTTLRSADQNTDPRNWVEDPDTMGWWGATYSTGELIGYTAAAFDSLSADSVSGRSGAMHIQGARHARQLLTATQDTTVDGVWVYHGHSSSANGQPMTVELKSGNSTLATASIPHNTEVRSIVAGAGSDVFKRTASVWSYQPLSRDVNLVSGNEYSIEFSAPSGAGFRLISLANQYGGVYSAIPEYIAAGGGEAERSENSGSTWTQFAGSSSSFGRNRSLQTLLTVKGMPRTLSE